MTPLQSPRPWDANPRKPQHSRARAPVETVVPFGASGRDDERSDHAPDAASVAATRDQSVFQVTRNHALFGLAVVLSLVVVLLVAGVL